jgi:hypothetical protein
MVGTTRVQVDRCDERGIYAEVSSQVLRNPECRAASACDHEPPCLCFTAMELRGSRVAQDQHRKGHDQRRAQLETTLHYS